MKKASDDDSPGLHRLNLGGLSGACHRAGHYQDTEYIAAMCSASRLEQAEKTAW